MLRRSRLPVAAFLLAFAACSSTTEADTTTTIVGSETTPSTTTGTTSTDTSDANPPVTDERVIEWQRIDDPAFDGGFLNAVVEIDSGLVAVGNDEVPEDAAVWVSPDGTSWERIASDAFRGEEDDNGLEGTQFMSHAVTGPAGIIAVGGYERRAERDLDPGVWISTDGRAWERVIDADFEQTGDGHLNAVIEWNGTYVAAGQDPGPAGSEERRPAIWTSSDGREWDRVSSAALRVDGVITAITSRGSRLIAVGTTGHVGRPSVWFSDDGLAWDVITPGGDGLIGDIDIGDTEDLEDMFMTSVAITRNGFVAAGGVGEPSRTAFWSSADGLFWALTGITADVERSTMPVFAEAMLTTGDGIVAVGTGRLDTTRFPPISYAQVWISLDDGSTWAQQPRTSSSMAVSGPESPWHIGAMHDLISVDGGVLAVGYVPYQDVTLPGPFYHQAVWLGTWE
jgi:hypothetical protein